MEDWITNEWVIIAGVAIFLVLLFRDFAEVVITLLVIAVIALWVSMSHDPAYYNQCTTAGHSYVHCFYERVIKL